MKEETNAWLQFACVSLLLTYILSQVHKLHLESGMKTATFHTKCLMFLALELKKKYWIVSTLPLHLLSVEDLIMPLHSAREVFNDKQNSASSYSILFLSYILLCTSYFQWSCQLYWWRVKAIWRLLFIWRKSRNMCQQSLGNSVCPFYLEGF